MHYFRHHGETAAAVFATRRTLRPVIAPTVMYCRPADGPGGLGGHTFRIDSPAPIWRPTAAVQYRAELHVARAGNADLHLVC